MAFLATSIAAYTINYTSRTETVQNRAEEEKKRRNKRDEQDKDAIKQPAVFILEFEYVFRSLEWHRHSAVVK